MEVCGYVGPVTVSLEAYSSMLQWEFARVPEVKAEDITSALGGLVLSPEAVEFAGLAVSSGRSLFVYGPSGNGKSSLGRQIHGALRGDFWIPHSIAVRNSVIRLFDEQVHERVKGAWDQSSAVDQRWVRIRRPLVVGLIASPERLIHIRKNRLLSLNEETETEYVDLDSVRAEVAVARRLFAEKGWPVIDVTRRSIEETAAAVLALHSRARQQPVE